MQNSEIPLNIQAQQMLQSPVADPVGAALLLGGAFTAIVAQVYARKRGIYEETYEQVYAPTSNPILTSAPPAPPAPFPEPAPLPEPEPELYPTPPTPPTVTSSATPAIPVAQDDWHERIDYLRARLDEDGALPLLKLVGTTPLRIIGQQRSGKSTFVKALAHLRTLFIDSKTEVWSPDDEGQESSGQWPKAFEVYGLTNGKVDYRVIESRMRIMLTRIERGDRSGKRTIIMDEFGSYGINDIPHALLKNLVQVSMMRGAKMGELVILILHGHTAEFLGGVKGMQTMLDQYTTVWLDREEDELGNAKPGRAFRITGLDGEQTIRRPQWLTAQWLEELFPELVPQVDRGSGRIDPRDFAKLTEQEQDLILADLSHAIESRQGKEATLTSLFDCARGGNAKWEAASKLWEAVEIEVSRQLISRCHDLEV